MYKFVIKYVKSHINYRKKLNIKHPEEEIMGDNIRAVARDFQNVEDASFLFEHFNV